MKRYGVRLSHMHAGDRPYRSTAVRPAPQKHRAAAQRSAANVGSATFSAYVGSRTEHRLVYRRSGGPITWS